MSSQLMPTEKDVKLILETHDLLPEGPILDEALKVVSLYAEKIQQVLSEFPETVDRHIALLAILEEGLMQEGFIPSSQGRKFEAPGRRRG